MESSGHSSKTLQKGSCPNICASGRGFTVVLISSSHRPVALFHLPPALSWVMGCHGNLLRLVTTLTEGHISMEDPCVEAGQGASMLRYSWKDFPCVNPIQCQLYDADSNLPVPPFMKAVE